MPRSSVYVFVQGEGIAKSVKKNYYLKKFPHNADTSNHSFLFLGRAERKRNFVNVFFLNIFSRIWKQSSNVINRWELHEIRGTLVHPTEWMAADSATVLLYSCIYFFKQPFFIWVYIIVETSIDFTAYL